MFKRIKGIVAVTGSLLYCLIPSNVHAQSVDTGFCGGGQSLYSALASVDAGDYDVFIRFGRPSDSGKAELYVQTINIADSSRQDCRKITSGLVDGKNWSKLGVYSVANSKDAVTLTIASSEIAGGYGASGPTVVLVPQNSPPCDFASGCEVEYEGQKMQLSPQKISLTSDLLKVGVIRSYQTDTVKEVIYSIDDRPTYTTPTLEPFNLKYVSPGNHLIQRTVILNSRQSLSDSQAIVRQDSLINYVSPLYLNNKNTLLSIGLILVLIIGLLLLLTSYRYVRYRHVWKRNHFIRQDNKLRTRQTAGPRRNISKTNDWRSVIGVFFKVSVGVVCAVAVFIFISSLVISTFRVDGVSMETTLRDTTTRLLLRLPVSVGKLNNHPYLPKRGQVVVFKKDENNLFDSAVALDPSYVVKRVIALPGERVQIKDGVITVYNHDTPGGFNPDVGKQWSSGIMPSEGLFVDLTLKTGEIFVAGDNRLQSIDSRIYGPINLDQIVGAVL